MRMRHAVKSGSALAVLALTLVTGCTSVLAGQPAGTRDKKVCEFLQGSPNSGLNRAVQAAVGVAHSRLGVAAVVRAGTSPDIASFISGHCGLIVGAGYEEAAPIF